MMRRAIQTLVAGALLLSSPLSAEQRGQRPMPAGLTSQSWTVAGASRTALISVPRATRPETGWPVVFVFHGHGGTSAQASRSFRIHDAWPEALVIYPQGVPTVGQVTDPEGRLPGWQHVPGGEDDRDLRFFDAMLVWAKETHRIDSTRVFAAGHSNGGSMVYTLWAARGAALAGVAPSSSIFRPDVVRSATPKPVFIVAGRQDALVPFRSQELSLNRVLALNQAKATAEPKPDGTRRHTSSAGSDVVTLIHEGGHQLPATAGVMMSEFFKSIR